MTSQHQEKPEEVTIEEVQSLLEQENRPPLIDVRDAEEFVLGSIPTSHNIPLSELDNALAVISDQEFKEKYNLDRFSKDDEVIFYCRSGRRSRLAFAQARNLGFTHMRHYPGSWNEWVVKVPQN